MERLLLPALAVGVREQHGLDVSGPHHPADAHRLLADLADGLTVPPADPDQAGMDAGPVSDHRDDCFDGILGHRDLERVDLPETQLPPDRSRISRRDSAKFLPARSMGRTLLRDQLFPLARGADQSARTPRKAGVDRPAGDASLPT